MYRIHWQSGNHEDYGTLDRLIERIERINRYGVADYMTWVERIIR